MSKASRAKRRRAAVRAAQRSNNNRFWYAITALVVVVGVVAIVIFRANQPPELGPKLASSSHPADHWHAALGVYDCDHWVGDPSVGNGLWLWPAQTSQGSPGRVGTDAYAGLHSHGDGIIHMEPATTDEAGKNATVGKYFQFGGWKLSSSGYTFLTTTVKNGEKCKNGQPGVLKWAVGKWTGGNKVAYKVHTGNPGSYKLYNADVIIVAFVPANVDITKLGNPPSLPNLASAAGNTGQTIAPSSPSTAPSTTPTTRAATSTSKP
jgi:hypothetical protein